MRVFGVDSWTLDVLQLEMAEGRFFSPDFATDLEEGYVINQSAAKLMRMDPAVGQRFNMWRRQGRIIGVVKDFNFRSLHQEIEPLILSMMPGWSNYLCIRLSAGDLQASLQHIETTWKTLVPHQPFEFHFLDETYENLYRSEERTGTLLGCFTALALIISCLGLTGLASFMAERRTKEIGIRKTIGASVSGLVFLLSKEFLKLVGLSTIMAWPVGYFAMDTWLSGFAYQTKLGYGVFVSAGLTALVIAFITIGYQTTRVAAANPVEALRYE
jgi:putative ABC transport system permease protein